MYTTQFDIWMSQCNEYLQTLGLPASTTLATSSGDDAQTVDLGAVQAQVISTMGQFRSRGLVKRLVLCTSTATARGSRSTNRGGGRREGKRRIAAMAALMLGLGWLL